MLRESSPLLIDLMSCTRGFICALRCRPRPNTLLPSRVLLYLNLLALVPVSISCMTSFPRQSVKKEGGTGRQGSGHGEFMLDRRALMSTDVVTAMAHRTLTETEWKT